MAQKGDQQKIERYKRLLKMYRDINIELDKLAEDGHALEGDLQKIIDHEKMQKVLQYINKQK